jgi:hypothetical protein
MGVVEKADCFEKRVAQFLGVSYIHVVFLLAPPFIALFGDTIKRIRRRKRGKIQERRTIPPTGLLSIGSEASGVCDALGVVVAPLVESPRLSVAAVSSLSSARLL